MSTDFGPASPSRRIIDMLQCNTSTLKNVIDDCRGKDLPSAGQSGIVPFAACGILLRAVLIDGDKIQFASGAAAVQDYSAEAEKLGVRSLFYQPLREDMA